MHQRKRFKPSASNSFLYMPKKEISAYLHRFDKLSISCWKLFNNGETNLRASYKPQTRNTYKYNIKTLKLALW